MSIQKGTEYQINLAAKEYFNSAETLTVKSNNGTTVQFTLGGNKGRGSMPIEHLDYLLKKDKLTLLTNKRHFIQGGVNEEQIG